MDELFKCDICKNALFSDPQSLPCGKTICKDCVLNKFDDKLECILCLKKHSKSELRTNELLNNLIMENERNKLSSASKSESEIILSSFLNRIKYKSKEFVQRMGSPSDLVKDHCDKIRNKVKLTEESLIKSIKDEFAEFMVQVNDYENECLKNLNSKDNKIKKDLSKIKSDSEEFVSKWKNYLNSKSFDEIDLISVHIKAKEIITELSRKEIDFKSLIFNRKILRFWSKIQLIKSNCYIYFDDKCDNLNENEEFKIEEFGKMKISDKLKGYSWNSVVQDSNSSNQTFVLMKFKILWFNYWEFQLTKINLDENKVITQCFEAPYGLLMNRAHHPYIDVNSSNIYLICDCKDNSSIFVFDQNLTLQKSSKFCHRIWLSAINKTRIFCFDNSKIYIYNKNFFLLSTVGQDLNIHEPFYLNNLRTIKATDEFLVLLNDKNQINVVGINNGKIHSQFEINSHEFFIYMDFCILTYDQESIRLYTFDGEKYEFKINPNDRMPNLRLVGFNQKGLSFLNSNTNDLYICDAPKYLLK